MKWIHNLLKCFSFSAVLFTFEACYGTPEDMYEDEYDCAVQVVDADGNGISNVEVTVKDSPSGTKVFADTTNNAGLAYVKYLQSSSLNLEFSFRPLENVDFQPKDTTLQIGGRLENGITVTLDHK